MSSLDPSVQAAIVTAIAGAVGTFLGAIGTFAVTFMNKRSEDRKHAREQITRAAIEYWQKHHELILGHAGGRKVEVMPLDSYLVHVAAISDMVFNKKVTAENIPKLLRKAHEIGIAADKELRRINEENP